MSVPEDQLGQTVPTAGLTPALTNLLNASFERVNVLWQRLDRAITQPPVASSASAIEHQDVFSAFSHDLAASFLRASVDHLVTWHTVITNGFMPTYAHLSLIRTAHESAWFAYWLLEPGVGSSVRLARGVAAQRDDLEERRRIEDAMGNPVFVPPAKSAADRIDDLMAGAEARGLTKPNKNGKPILSTALLSAVELFDLYEPVAKNDRGSYLYRLYSGYAHGKQWAITQGAQALEPADSHGNRLASVEPDFSRAVAATQRVVSAMEKAVDALIVLRS